MAASPDEDFSPARHWLNQQSVHGAFRPQIQSRPKSPGQFVRRCDATSICETWQRQDVDPTPSVRTPRFQRRSSLRSITSIPQWFPRLANTPNCVCTQAVLTSAKTPVPFANSKSGQTVRWHTWEAHDSAISTSWSLLSLLVTPLLRTAAGCPPVRSPRSVWTVLASTSGHCGVWHYHPRTWVLGRLLWGACSGTTCAAHPQDRTRPGGSLVGSR